MPDAIDERIAEILRQPYHWLIQPGEDGYSTSVLEFPGCLSSGDTPEEAVAELQDAITAPGGVGSNSSAATTSLSPSTPSSPRGA